jgi:hypothetical protein
VAVPHGYADVQIVAADLAGAGMHSDLTETSRSKVTPPRPARLGPGPVSCDMSAHVVLTTSGSP